MQIDTNNFFVAQGSGDIHEKYEKKFQNQIHVFFWLLTVYEKKQVSRLSAIFEFMSAVS